MVDETRLEPRQDLRDVPVAEAMHVGVLTCQLDAPLLEVARTMAEHRVHCVVACDERGLDEAGSLWGVVSDLDLVAAASARAMGTGTAGQTAVTPVVTVAADESLDRAAQLMTEHAVTHLVVVDARGKRPVGVLSTLDVARVLARGTS
jgi:CBS domain-containing protein